MSEFNKAVDELAENIKTPEQIIEKRLLASLIEDTEEAFQEICNNPDLFEQWHKDATKSYLKLLLSRNIREWKKLNQKLGYEGVKDSEAIRENETEIKYYFDRTDYW